MPVADLPASLESLPPLLSEDQLVALGIGAGQTLQNWRAKRIGPPFTKCGRSVRYPKDKLIAWLESNLVDTSAE